MDALGHPLTWRTRCFLGCSQLVFAHTNGHGDFVLFDKLERPWPIHECYFDRFNLHVGRSRKVAYRGTPIRPWDEITPITPDAHGPRKRYGFIGTITNVEKGFVNKSEEFRALTSRGAEEVRKVLAGRTSLLTVVTGQGAEFTAFFDIKRNPIRFRDIVVCDLKPVSLFNKSIFVVTQMRRFESGE